MTELTSKADLRKARNVVNNQQPTLYTGYLQPQTPITGVRSGAGATVTQQSPHKR